MMLTTEICDSISGSVRLAWRGVGVGGGALFAWPVLCPSHCAFCQCQATNHAEMIINSNAEVQ